MTPWVRQKHVEYNCILHESLSVQVLATPKKPLLKPCFNQAFRTETFYGFLYVIIIEVVFWWDLAKQGPTPKDTTCFKIKGAPSRFEKITIPRKKNVKRQTSENPVKKPRKIRFVQKGKHVFTCFSTFCDYETHFSRQCSRCMWLPLVLRCGIFASVKLIFWTDSELSIQYLSIIGWSMLILSP